MGSRSPGIEKLNAIPPFWRLVVSLLVAVGMLGVWLFAFVHNWLVSGEDLPVALHSPLSADYSPDAVFVIPAARLNLLRDALSDEVRAGNDSPADQLATVVEQMRTPVFTVTPFPGSTSTLGGQPTQTQNQQQTQEAPQETRAAPSSTSTVPMPTVTTTLTSLPTFFQPTATSYPATQTARPTNPPVVAMPTKTQTNTQVIPPSATSAPSPTMNPPTNTPVPPTSTHVPPTNTPVPQEPTDDYPPPPPPLPTNYP